MYEEHPVFNPPSADAVLWRYMDFTKFVSILDKGALFFPPAAKLGDPFEGAFSEINKTLRPVIYQDLSEDTLRGFARYLKESCLFTLISCWHENSHESEAMWRLYAREKDGVAIKADFDSFKKSFTCSKEVYIGKVSYVDYKTEFIPESNTFYPFLHKRKSFAHEHEVRAITTYFTGDEICNKLRRGDLTGMYYEVDLSLLIKKVIVAPFAQDWFMELVNSVVDRYDLKVPVVKSTLADTPTWG